MRPAIWFFPLLSTLCVFAGTVQAQPQTRTSRYCLTVTHIWTSPNPEDPFDLHVKSINNKGEIVGYGAGPHASQGAFLWRKGQFIDLGAQIGHAGTSALAINDHGDVVGAYSNDGEEFQAFLLRHGRVIDVHGVPGETSTAAFEVNDRRQVLVIGPTVRPEYFRNPDRFIGRESFFRWERGTVAQLEPLEPGGQAVARHMNDRGIVAGSSESPVEVASRAVLWQDGTVMDLGLPEGTESADAVDVNTRGQVAVNVTTHREGRFFSIPFIWQDGEFIELQLIGDAPYGAVLSGINDKGVAIGTTSTLLGEFLYQIPTVWRNGSAADLNTLICSSDPLQPYVQLAGVPPPLLINNRGQIVIMATDLRLFPWRGFYMLTPKR